MAILDLHLHSCYSDDGELTPRELMELCQQNGVATAALADHNTAKGVGEAMDWAEKLGVVLIPAIELDCSVEGVNLHVLGYWINPDDPAFEQVYQSILTQEKSASAIRMEKVKALGIRFSDDEVLRLSKNGTVTGEMIAEAAMANNENNDNPLMAPYFPGGARSDNPYVNFYWDFCAQGKAAYAPVQYMSLKQAVGIIRGAGGIPVLAHPGNNIAENESLLETIVSHGVCGLEAYSSYHQPQQTAFYLEQANRRKLAVTCGSDFHGRTKPSIRLGGTACNGQEVELFDKLVEKYHRAQWGV